MPRKIHDFVQGQATLRGQILPNPGTIAATERGVATRRHAVATVRQYGVSAKSTRAPQLEGKTAQV